MFDAQAKAQGTGQPDSESSHWRPPQLAASLILNSAIIRFIRSATPPYDRQNQSGPPRRHSPSIKQHAGWVTRVGLRDVPMEGLVLVEAAAIGNHDY
jgi:hypothetical protein